MLSIQQDIKDLRRLKEILVIFFKAGFGYYIHKSKFSLHLPFKHKLGRHSCINDQQQLASRLRKSFEKLGPTFVKLGQLLSLRPDLVPEIWAKEFEKLQDSVPKFSYPEVKQTIEQDFKVPLENLFPYFEHEPIASASVSQVHRARLASGEEVAVKVRRPNIKEIIDTDLDILFLIAYTLEKRFPETRNYKPINIIKEFALWTRRELDFTREAENALRIKAAASSNPKIKIPAIYTKYCSQRVLVMEYIHGQKLSALISQKKHNRNIVKIYFCSILEQALLHGIFHADPHPANIFVDQDKTLVYLDFGIVGELSITDRKKIIEFIRSLPEKDPNKSFKIILSLARSVDPQQVDEFKDQALPILRSVYTNTISQVSLGRALYKVICLGAQNNIIFDSNHVLMAKAVYQAEGLALQLYPNFNVGKELQGFERKFLMQTYNPLQLVKAITTNLKTQKEAIISFPEHILKLMERLEQSPVAPHCEEQHWNNLEQKIAKSLLQHQLTSITIWLLLAALIFFYLEGKNSFLGLPISVILLILVIIVILYSLISKYNFHWRYEL